MSPYKSRYAVGRQPDSYQQAEMDQALAERPSGLVLDIFDTWAKTRENTVHPTRTRLGWIARALTWGYPLADVYAAVQGWTVEASIPNPSFDRSRYCELCYLLRSPETLEKFRDYWYEHQTARQKQGFGAGPRAKQAARARLSLVPDVVEEQAAAR